MNDSGEKALSTLRHTFSLKEFYEFAIEWQRVTGGILKLDSRTAPYGEAKLEDAKERADVLATLIKDGAV